jgi:hypothetical protein
MVFAAVAVGYAEQAFRPVIPKAWDEQALRWFDPARLRDDYVPTGFRGHGFKTRAIKGHEFGLKLKPDEKKALIAFLLTL